MLSGRSSRLSSPDSRIKRWRSRYRTEPRADTSTTSVDVRFASRRNLSARNDGAKPTLTTAGNPGKRTRPGTPRRTASGEKPTRTTGGATMKRIAKRRPKTQGAGVPPIQRRSPRSVLQVTIVGGRDTGAHWLKTCRDWRYSSEMTGSAKLPDVSTQGYRPALMLIGQIRYLPALITSFRWRVAARTNGQTW